MNEQIKEMTKAIPNNIIASDGNPAGQHLYIEQREFIAEQLYNAGYRKMEDMPKMTLTERDKIRKETAKDILQCWADDNTSENISNRVVKGKAKAYGVELDL